MLHFRHCGSADLGQWKTRGDVVETNCNGDLDLTINRRNFRPSCEHDGDVREKHWRNSTRMFNVL